MPAKQQHNNQLDAGKGKPECQSHVGNKLREGKASRINGKVRMQKGEGWQWCTCEGDEVERGRQTKMGRPRENADKHCTMAMNATIKHVLNKHSVF